MGITVSNDLTAISLSKSPPLSHMQAHQISMLSTKANPVKETQRITPEDNRDVNQTRAEGAVDRQKYPDDMNHFDDRQRDAKPVGLG